MDLLAIGLWALIVLNALGILAATLGILAATLGILAAILTIGQPSKPRTPGEAVATLIIGVTTIAVLWAALEVSK